MTPLPVLDCGGCGLCCGLQPSPPFLPTELDALAPGLVGDIEARLASRGFAAGAACFWMDRGTRKCRHYEDRPEVCRQFELGGEDCLAMRAAAGPGEILGG